MDGEEEEQAADWMIDLECALVEHTGWSLVDIDATDINSLIPFMFRYPTWKGQSKAKKTRRQLYADQVNWL